MALHNSEDRKSFGFHESAKSTINTDLTERALDTHLVVEPIRKH